MKRTILFLILAVIVFGQPAAVFASFSVQPQQVDDIYSQGFQQAMEEPMQLQKNTAVAEEQGIAEAEAAVKALAAEADAAEAAAAAEDSSSGDKTLMFIIGGLLTSIGVGAKFLIG